jgi:hypothetical protein
MNDMHLLKLIEAGATIADSLYLNFCINSFSEEYNSLVNMVDFEVDTVEEVVGKLCQMEIKKSLCTVDNGVVFLLQRKPQGSRPQRGA